MSINKLNIEKQYNEEKDFFARAASEIKHSLDRIASIYYESTRLKVFIPHLRIKTFKSIIDKLERKDRIADSLFSRTEDGVSLVTNDFIGGRILCNTNEDVVEIVKIIETSNRFSVGKKDELNKPSGYRAVHLDLEYKIFWKDELVTIPLEIQVKTFFQHAWAEVTHDDTYKPEDNLEQNIPAEEYYKNIATVLDGLDGFLSTIRSQKLSYVKPPTSLSDSDTVINSKTLSFKIDEWKKGTQFTNQEMNIAIRRLKEEGFETLQDVNRLLGNDEISKSIKLKKEKLKNFENVSPFDLLIYGSLLYNKKDQQAEEEIQKDLGFVKHRCVECKNYLTEEEYDFILTNTDSDFDFFCKKHIENHFKFKCDSCGKLTTSKLCLECEVQKNDMF